MYFFMKFKRLHRKESQIVWIPNNTSHFWHEEGALEYSV